MKCFLIVSWLILKFILLLLLTNLANLIAITLKSLPPFIFFPVKSVDPGGFRDLVRQKKLESNLTPCVPRACHLARNPNSKEDSLPAVGMTKALPSLRHLKDFAPGFTHR